MQVLHNDQPAADDLETSPTVGDMPSRSPRVMLTTEAQAELLQIASDFERDGADAELVLFGREGQAQGMIIPWEMWMEMLDHIEDYLFLRRVRQRINSGEPSIEMGMKDAMRVAGIDDPDEFIRSMGYDPDILE